MCATTQSYRRRNNADRVAIPLEGSSDTEFYTRSGLQVAKGYIRVVIGKRGPYIEFSDDQVVMDSLFIPEKEKYRLNRDFVFYNEYRTTDKEYVKFYHQKQPVSYADYKVGLWYASPQSLVTKDCDLLYLPLYETIEEKIPDKPNLFNLMSEE